MLADKPAFPSSEKNSEGLHYHSHLGLSFRQYLIAHAPHEPQPWFKPEIPDCPKVLLRLKLKPEDFQDIQANAEGLMTVADVSAAVNSVLGRAQQSQEEVQAWRDARDKARYIQWPAAWADAILAELEKGKP